MNTTNTFLVVEGVLYERLEFALLRGYETARVPVQQQHQEPTGPFVAELVGEGGMLLNRTPLGVRFPQGCFAKTASPGAGLVRAALPYHPMARRFVLRAYDQEIFSMPVGEHAPEIRGVKVKRRKEAALVHLDFGKAEPEHVELFLELKSGRRFPLDAEVKGGRGLVDLSGYAGFEAGRIRVRASRELRSGEAWSDFVALPAAVVHARILAPRAGDEWPAGHPGSLVANLADQNGRRVEWDAKQVRWMIDGEVLDGGRAVMRCGALKPGPHTAALWYGQANKPLDEVRFTVRKPSEAQKDYDALVARYLSGKHGVPRAAATRPRQQALTAEADG